MLGTEYVNRLGRCIGRMLPSPSRLLLAVYLAFMGALGYSLGGLPATFALMSHVRTVPANAVATAASFAPATLNGAAAAAGAVSLAWTAPAGDAAWVTGYDVWRSTTTGGPYVVKLTSSPLGPAIFNYSDASTLNGTTYFYVVRAVSGNGGSAANSPEASATADAVAPSVSSVAPADAATAAPINVNVVVNFSEPVNAAATQAAFTLQQTTRTGSPCYVIGATPLCTQSGGTFAWSNGNTTLTFDPDNNLAPTAQTTQYTVTVAATASDPAGNTLTPAFSSTFTTSAAGSDTTRPYATSHSPSGSGVGRNANIQVSFSEAMVEGSAQSAFCLSTTTDCTSGQVSGAFSWNGGSDSLTFDPAGLLAASTTYYVRIPGTGGSPATDVAGNRLCATEGVQCASDPATAYTFSFTTAAGTAPTVLYSLPGDGETSFTQSANIQVIFSEAMNTTTTEAAFSLYKLNGNGGTPCYVTGGTLCNANNAGGTLTWADGNTRLIFDPEENLQASRDFTISVSTAATSNLGISLANAYTASFLPSTGGRTIDTTGAPPFYPGTVFAFDGTGWGTSASITRCVKAHWDDVGGAAPLLGTVIGGPSDVQTDGTFTLTGVTVPLTASQGLHTITVQRYTQSSGCATVAGAGQWESIQVYIQHPDALTLTTSETDLKLFPGQSGVTLTATVKKDDSPLANAGVKFTLSSIPASCAGGALSPVSGTLQQTNGSGQASVSLTACSAVFTDMTVQVLTGGSLTQSLAFADPPPDPPDDLILDPEPLLAVQEQTTAPVVSAPVVTPTPLPTAAARPAKQDRGWRLHWSGSRHPATAGYWLHLGVAPEQLTPVQRVTGATTAVVRGLEAGTSYYVQLRAFDSNDRLGPPSRVFLLAVPDTQPKTHPTVVPTLTPTPTPIAAATQTPIPTATATAAASTTPTHATGNPVVTLPVAGTGAAGAVSPSPGAGATATPVAAPVALPTVTATPSVVPVVLPSATATAPPAGDDRSKATPAATAAAATPAPPTAAATATVAPSPVATPTPTLGNSSPAPPAAAAQPAPSPTAATGGGTVAPPAAVVPTAAPGGAPSASATSPARGGTAGSAAAGTAPTAGAGSGGSAGPGAPASSGSAASPSHPPASASPGTTSPPPGTGGQGQTAPASPAPAAGRAGAAPAPGGGSGTASAPATGSTASAPGPGASGASVAASGGGSGTGNGSAGSPAPSAGAGGASSAAPASGATGGGAAPASGAGSR